MFYCGNEEPDSKSQQNRDEHWRHAQSSSAPVLGVFTATPVGKSHPDTVQFDLTPPQLAAQNDLRNDRVAAVSCWESSFVHGIQVLASTKVLLSHASLVQFIYELDGKRIEGPEARGAHGKPSHSEFALEHDEFITAVGGRGGEILDQLSVVTNKGRVKKWGGSGGAPFSFDLPDGFHVISMVGGFGGHIHTIAPVFTQRVQMGASDVRDLLELLKAAMQIK